MSAKILFQVFIAFLIVAFGQPSFAPWLTPLTAALGFAIFWHSIRIFPFKYQKFVWGTCWFLCVSLVQLSWMTSIEYQGLYMLGVFITLALWLGLHFGFLTTLLPYNKPLTMPRILAMASLWTLLEWSRFHVLCGFSWNPVGLSLSNIYALQFASLFGILGLSFWVIFVNLLALRAFIYKIIPHWGLWILAATIPYLFGLGHTAYHQNQIAKRQSTTKKYSCVLVQTGLLPDEKILLKGRIHAFISPYDQWERILLFLKEHKNNNPDLIVLPEGVVPLPSHYCYYNFLKVKEIFYEVFGNIDENIFPQLSGPFGNQNFKVTNIFWTKTIANLFQSEVIAGLDYEEASGLAYNSAFHIAAENEGIDRYDKRVLMPLAEYLPFQFLSSLVEQYGITNFFSHGTKANIFRGKLPVSVSICYEETFPNQVRLGRLEGAKILVNLTSDSWYPQSRLPSQHFEHAKFRAIENGAPLLRACNTGITIVLDSLGRTVGKIEQEHNDIKSGVLFAEINPYEYTTLFTLWGNAGILTICGSFLGIFILLRKKLFW